MFRDLHWILARRGGASIALSLCIPLVCAQHPVDGLAVGTKGQGAKGSLKHDSEYVTLFRLSGIVTCR